jgi:cell division protein FtsB
MKFKLRRAVLILSLFVLLAGVHLFIFTQNISLKYKVTDLKIRLSEIQSKNRQLGSQVAKKENLPYIEKIAKEKLNMVYPEEINYILEGSGRVSKEARP